MPDPNSPGLFVCPEDLDQYDPYRLPARQAEKINLDFVRPDDPLVVTLPQAEDDFRIIQTDDPRITEVDDPRITEHFP